MIKKAIFPLIVLILLLTLTPPAQSQPIRAVTLAEGHDFATKVLREPWDMDEYADISQYINQSGQVNYLENVSVANGIFSATSNSDYNDAQFFALWPGYQTAILNGKVGNKFPIDASEYHCLYVGMKTSLSDYWQVFWFEDETLNGGDTWGFSDHHRTEANLWKLYEMDLASEPPIAGYDPWTASAVWRGLRIDPTRGGSFEIDWIRLTDCTPVTHPVNYSGAGGEVSIFIRPEGTSREILVDSGDFGGSYSLDVQGVEPGHYDILVKSSSGTVLHSEEVIVNHAPIVTFDQPSFTSGIDFANQAGNAWDMNSVDDVENITCTAYSFSNGVLNLSTPSVGSQPPSCVGGTVSDPKIYLNVPAPIEPDEYRYFSFRMNTEGPWQNVPEGMMIRLIWTFTAPTGTCIYVSQDIPFNVGWYDYTVDLWDSFDGSAEVAVGSCPNDPTPTWRESYPVYNFRLDPNENITGTTMVQAIDWIKLTRNNYGNTVSDYPIYYSVNKEDYISIDFYYTTDPVNNPTQHAMAVFEPAPPQDPPGPLFTYLPMIVHGVVYDSEKVIWETENVSSGEYFICVVVDDGYNQNTHCSEASVIIQ